MASPASQSSLGATRAPRWVANFILRGIWDELERRGASSAALERMSGVSRPREGDLFSGVAYADTHVLFEVGMKLIGEPTLGLSVGRAIGPSAFHLLGHLALACATLPEALELADRAYPRAGFRFPVLEALPGDRMRFGLPSRVKQPRPGLRFEAELAAVLMHDLLLQFLDLDVAAPSVEFAFQPTTGRGPYHRAFPGGVTFGGEGTYAVFPRAALVTRRSGADAQLVGQLLRLAHDHYGQAADSPGEWTLRVRDVLRADAAPRSVVTAALAAQLDLSSRGLSRRLAREGTSLSALIDAELYERAQALLRRPGSTAAQVASALGYAELASFFRAFRRWSGGLTPSAYRRRAREA